MVGDTVSKGAVIGTVADLAPLNSNGGDHLHFGIRMAPVSGVAPRGALPISNGSGTQPTFPEYFIDPLQMEYQFQ